MKPAIILLDSRRALARRSASHLAKSAANSFDFSAAFTRRSASHLAYVRVFAIVSLPFFLARLKLALVIGYA